VRTSNGLGVVLAGALLAGSLAGSSDPAWGDARATRAPEPTASCGPAWSAVPTPDIGDSVNLTAVDASSASVAWIAGAAGPAFEGHGIVEHFGGGRWRVVDPGPGMRGSGYTDVSAESPSDVWLAGSKGTDPLVLHFNGSSWTDVSPPPRGRNSNQVAALEAVAPDDVWAVGFAYAHGEDNTLIQHWNGHRWTVATPPVPHTFLVDVAAAASDDVWAVGGIAKEMAFHWNGMAWTRAPRPGAPAISGLNGVDVTADGTAWATASGSNEAGTMPALTSSVERWNGSTWARLAEDEGNGDTSPFFALGRIAAVSDREAWAVGAHPRATRGSKPVIAHSVGRTTTLERVPGFGTGYGSLHDVAAAPGGGHVWAVGEQREGSHTPFAPLVLQRCD
jgi:hypothetical protein